jgi:predicted site-specific integrase-resolvase
VLYYNIKLCEHASFQIQTVKEALSPRSITFSYLLKLFEHASFEIQTVEAALSPGSIKFSYLFKLCKHARFQIQTVKETLPALVRDLFTCTSKVIKMFIIIV